MDYIIVQAGGRGTRLKYLTQNKPKALVPIDNLPMLFHLFRKYPKKKFIIIADYKREVLHEYLEAFADVQYQIVDASGTGTCGGVRQALNLLPEKEAFMLVWSDLVLPDDFELPEDYADGQQARQNYVGISRTFPCRWKYENGVFEEQKSVEHGVAGFFLCMSKEVFEGIPDSGELVRWLQVKGRIFQEISLAGTKEFGLIEEYEKLETEKCRPFNKITREGELLRKEPLDEQGRELAKRECAWYEYAKEKDIPCLPKIYNTEPLIMEYIRGKNIYEYDLDFDEKKAILKKLIDSLERLHRADTIPADSFSLREAYYNKTMNRLLKIRDLVPFANEREIKINGRICRNIFYYKREFEKKIADLSCDAFCIIHGDCTFSNMMLRENGDPVLIDPRGYFGYKELYGDVRYDWAKMYYSIVGNYDRFNLKDFRLSICADEVCIEIASNHWEDMENVFFELTGADPYEIKLLHAVIWLSLTTYAWQDYDSVCGAFYNGLYYLEEVL